MAALMAVATLLLRQRQAVSVHAGVSAVANFLLDGACRNVCGLGRGACSLLSF